MATKVALRSYTVLYGDGTVHRVSASNRRAVTVLALEHQERKGEWTGFVIRTITKRAVKVS